MARHAKPKKGRVARHAQKKASTSGSTTGAPAAGAPAGDNPGDNNTDPAGLGGSVLARSIIENPLLLSLLGKKFKWQGIVVLYWFGNFLTFDLVEQVIDNKKHWLNMRALLFCTISVVFACKKDKQKQNVIRF